MKNKVLSCVLVMVFVISACSSQNSAPDTAPSVASVAETIEKPTDDTPPISELVTINRNTLYAIPASVTNPAGYASAPYIEPAGDLSNVINLHQSQGDEYWSYEEFADILATPDAIKMMAENGFVIDRTQSLEFFGTYIDNKYLYIPSFVTVDSIMHTYHLFFEHLLKHTEKDYLYDRLLNMSNALYQNTLAQAEILSGSEWEEAITRNLVFLAVAKRLADPSADLNDLAAEERSMAESELALIDKADGISASPLFGDDEDYSQYKPRGYYEGDEKLEAYFRLMMWYGRRNFTQKEETLDRSALLLVLALSDSTLPEEALPDWEVIYSVTGFFAGESDDCLYYDYRPILSAAYSENVQTKDIIGNDDAFAQFHQLTRTTTPPQINSIPISDEGPQDSGQTRGFRVMGQRFTLDGAIFHNLIYDRVGANENGEYRVMPDPLDVTATLGSEASMDMLTERGDTGYDGYSEKMDEMRSYVEDAGDSFWTGSLYAGWLDTIRPLLSRKGEGYPFFMQSKAWELKNIECFLSSFTELKHGTVLYSKEETGGKGAGGPEIKEYDDRGYVEPEPVVFARLAHMTDSTISGLDAFGMLSNEDREDLERLSGLSSSLSTIAEKELRGELPTDEEFDLIRYIGEDLYDFWDKISAEEAARLGKDWFSSMDFPAALTVGIATNSDTGEILHIGTGGANTIYVIVPVDGSLRIAKGSVYNYYQFTDTKRLTDSEWQTLIGLNYMKYDDPSFKSVGPDDKPDWTLSYRMENE